MTSNTSTLLCTVDEMLLDAGETDPRLRATLLQLGALASLPVPEPRAELAALLSAPTSQLARQRLRRRHRTAAVGLAVIAGMGLGVTGVAATASAPSANARGSVQHLLQDWAPSWTIAGVPAISGGLPRTPAAEPGSPDGSVPAGPETVAPGSAAEDIGPGRSQDPGPGAASPGKPAADGGASRNSAGGTSGGGASQDGTGRKRPQPDAAPGSDPAGQLEKAGKLVAKAPAVVDSLTSALLAPGTTVPSTADPATTEKTGAGGAGPGSLWLKKFSR